MRDRAELRLSTARTSYHVHESVRFHLTLRNTSDRPLLGWFDGLGVRESRSKLYHWKVGSPPPRFDVGPPDGGYIEKVVTVPVHGTASAVLDVNLEPATERFMLAEPGEYNFKVVYQDVYRNRNAVLESEVLTLGVLPVLSNEATAFEAYSVKLALLAGTGIHRYDYGEGVGVRAEAQRFLERFPDSIYSPPLRDALLDALGTRVRGGNATPAEQGSYQRLRDQQRFAAASRAVAAPWLPNVDYRAGDRVTYDGVTWMCIRAHRSEPPSATLVAPPLWDREP